MPNKVAIFDVDGTLVDAQSQQLFLVYMRRKGLVSLYSYYRILTWFVLYKMGLVKDPKPIMNYAFSFLKGFEESRMTMLVDDFFRTNLQSHIFPEMDKLLRNHLAKGDRVFLVSNSLEYIVRAIGKYFGLEKHFCIGTKLEVNSGLLTGFIEGDMVYSSNKVTAIKNALAENSISPEETWGYSDHISDIEILNFTDHPHAVNPDSSLRAEALKRSWPISQFK